MNSETKQPQGTTVSLSDSTVPWRGEGWLQGSWLIPDIARGYSVGQDAYLFTHSTCTGWGLDGGREALSAYPGPCAAV